MKVVVAGSAKEGEMEKSSFLELQRGHTMCLNSSRWEERVICCVKMC